MAVDVAYDGETGHEKSTVTRYDVVVLDRDLPGMSGDELCKEILSSGAPTRTFCYVADAVLGYLKCLVHGTYDYFNIGNKGPELSVIGLAEEFRDAAAELWGYTGEVVFAQSDDPEYLTHNPQRRQPDVAKAKEILGYEASIGVTEGVRRYLRHVYLTDGAGAR